jgi:hypothetical protein
MKPPICPWRGLLSHTVAGALAKIELDGIWKSHPGILVRLATRFFHLLPHSCTGASELLQKNISAREQNEPGATKKCRQERHALEDDRNFIMPRHNPARPRAVGQ